MTEPGPLPPPLPPIHWLDRLDGVAAALGVERRRLLGFCVVVCVGLVVVAGVLVSRAIGAGREPTELTLPRATPRSVDGATDSASRSGPIVVAAAGAVVKPGVYRVATGARVIDVLQAAGGPAPDADVDRINLAAKVADGERVYVPRKGEATVSDPATESAASSGGSGASSVVDLNSASAAQLEALPGIGPATAQAIIDYRSKHGRFRSVNQLLEVRGIGEAKLEQLRPHVRVS